MTFQLGACVVTPAAQRALERRGLRAADFFALHHAGNIGSLMDDEWQHNVYARLRGEPVYSIFSIGDGKSVYLLTDADRTQTTLMLAEEYLSLRWQPPGAQELDEQEHAGDAA